MPVRATTLSCRERGAISARGRADRSAREVLDINTQARDRSLQFALLIPLIAALLGLGTSFRMIRLPDLKPSANVEEAGLG